MAGSSAQLLSLFSSLGRRFFCADARMGWKRGEREERGGRACHFPLALSSIFDHSLILSFLPLPSSLPTSLPSEKKQRKRELLKKRTFFGATFKGRSLFPLDGPSFETRPKKSCCRLWHFQGTNEGCSSFRRKRKGRDVWTLRPLIWANPPFSLLPHRKNGRGEGRNEMACVFLYPADSLRWRGAK